MTEKLLKVYHPAEEKLNVLSHALGSVAVLLGLFELLRQARGCEQIIAVTVYALSLMMVYLASTLYHGAKEQSRRTVLRKYDHSAIYLLIAGTYTPLMLVGVNSLTGNIILTVIWILAVSGVTLELAGVKINKRLSLAWYLSMGWLCVLVIKPLFEVMSMSGAVYLIAGGLAYTAGVVFYAAKWRYAHAVWHFFVLAGSTLQYFAVLTLLNG